MIERYQPNAGASGYALAAFQLAHANLRLLVSTGTVTVDAAIELLESMASELPDVDGATELFQAVINGMEERRSY